MFLLQQIPAENSIYRESLVLSQSTEILSHSPPLISMAVEEKGTQHRNLYIYINKSPRINSGRGRTAIKDSFQTNLPRPRSKAPTLTRVLSAASTKNTLLNQQFISSCYFLQYPCKKFKFLLLFPFRTSLPPMKVQVGILQL
ncbi:hypothetical protein L1049_017334 [Liquidambar formosana]|uniref:Uncharacterized protein n=1 Tax=Liquidambar formosana TaxID=63359 RepID=A0AAP0S3C5_LIQFO